MDKKLDQIKDAVRAQYDRGEGADPREWVERYPEFRSELLDFIIELKQLPPAVELEAEDVSSSTTGFERASRRSAERVRQTLERAEMDLGARLSRAREGSLADRPRMEEELTRAKTAMYAWVADVLLEVRGEASRLPVQKAAYLVEQALAVGVFANHEPNKWGLHDDDLTARIEKLALAARFLSHGPNRKIAHDLRRGSNIEQARQEARQQTSDPELAEEFLTFLANRPNEELETWSSVHYVVVRIAQPWRPVDVHTVRRAIQDTPAWTNRKLHRPHYAPAEIHSAIAHLVRLQLLPEDQIGLGG